MDGWMDGCMDGWMDGWKLGDDIGGGERWIGWMDKVDSMSGRGYWDLDCCLWWWWVLV